MKHDTVAPLVAALGHQGPSILGLGGTDSLHFFKATTLNDIRR